VESRFLQLVQAILTRSSSISSQAAKGQQ
jgi:hypothetical protein